MTIDKNAGFTVTDSSSDSYSVKCVKAKNKKLPLGRNVTSRKKKKVCQNAHLHYFTHKAPTFTSWGFVIT